MISGDKIICTKTLYNKSGPMNENRIIFRKGDILYIEVTHTIYYFRSKDLTVYGAFNDSSDHDIWSMEEIKDYYMTMAEWREQQINSILDD
jgi:hypothetical protein